MNTGDDIVHHHNWNTAGVPFYDGSLHQHRLLHENFLATRHPMDTKFSYGRLAFDGACD